jgi:hypothetical protein
MSAKKGASRSTHDLGDLEKRRNEYRHYIILSYALLSRQRLESRLFCNCLLNTIHRSADYTAIVTVT